MPMTEDPIRIIAYDALFPQLAALEAGMDLAAGQVSEEQLGALQAQYQQRIDEIRAQNPDLVQAVEQALPQLQGDLTPGDEMQPGAEMAPGGAGPMQRPAEDAPMDEWRNYRMSQRGSANASGPNGAGPAQPAGKSAGAPAAARGGSGSPAKPGQRYSASGSKAPATARRPSAS